jgi:hypothetical protein
VLQQPGAARNVTPFGEQAESDVPMRLLSCGLFTIFNREKAVSFFLRATVIVKMDMLCLLQQGSPFLGVAIKNLLPSRFLVTSYPRASFLHKSNKIIVDNLEY